MNVELWIERLVVDGLPMSAGDGEVLRATLQKELARRLRRDGLGARLTRGLAAPRLTVDSVRLPREAGPAEIARQVGRSLHGALSPQKGRGRGESSALRAMKESDPE